MECHYGKCKTQQDSFYCYHYKQNYIYGTTNGKTYTVKAATGNDVFKGETEIVAKKLTDSMVVVNPSSYTYTGGKITPNYAVIDGVIVLYKKAKLQMAKLNMKK